MNLEEKKREQLETLLQQLPTNNEKRLMDIPGIYYGGGCSYMACRGLMMSPIDDILLITHGPTGCGAFSGINSRNDTDEGRDELFRGRCFSTNMRESDIIFGGEQKLLSAIEEAVALFHPKAIAVCATCPVGLIGDDIVRIAKTAEARFNIRVLPLSCEGFRKNNGWLHGGKMLVESFMGETEQELGPYPIHFMCESYNGKNKETFKSLFERIGYDVVCSMMGSNTYERIRSGHQARLIVLDSGKAIDEVPLMIQKKFGGGFFRVSFTGISNIVSSLRKMADYFGTEDLQRRTEEVIAEEMAKIEAPWLAYRMKFGALTAALFEDIFRSDSLSALSSDLGIEIIMISQDYKSVDFTDNNFSLHLSRKKYDELLHIPQCSLPEPDREDNGRVYFKLSRQNVGEFLRLAHPSICFSGVEEQFGYSDAKIKSELFTSDERGVQYGGFQGLLRYARDLDMAVFMSHWITEKPEWTIQAEGIK
jgi:nitrogenase molybdenum-iron protein alpha chain